MADRANSTPAPAVHPLEGSTPPGSGRPTFQPTSPSRPGPKPRSQVRPRLHKRPIEMRDVSDEREVTDLAQSLVGLLKREPGLFRRLDMLERHALLPAKRAALEKVLTRTWHRISSRTLRLAATRAPTARAAALKAEALIERAVVDGRRADPFDALAISLAHDAGHLALEAACLPQHVGGNFAAYHREILGLHAAMDTLPAGTPDAETDVFMDRWGAIDQLAMMDRPRTMADAIAALAYARREFHQFHIENNTGEFEPCSGDSLTLHLLDGAAAVLKRVVQEDTGCENLRRDENELATIADYADLEFEAWDKDEFEPHTNQEWAKLYNPHLITARVAVMLCRKSKADLVKMVRGMPDEGAGSAHQMTDWLTHTKEFFEGYGKLIEVGWIRLMSAASTVAREDGEPEAQRHVNKPAAASPDRRAVAAYRQWLDMEGRLLGAEMYPQGGEDAYRFVPMNTAANSYHLPSGATQSWRDLPQPMSRAEAMCRVLGIDWTTDGERDEHFMPLAHTDAATATEAA